MRIETLRGVGIRGRSIAIGTKLSVPSDLSEGDAYRVVASGKAKFIADDVHLATVVEKLVDKVVEKVTLKKGKGS